MVPSTSPNGFAGVPPLSAARRRLDESRASAAAGAKHIQAMPRACADAAIKAGAKWMYGKLRDVKADSPAESPRDEQHTQRAEAARVQHLAVTESLLRFADVCSDRRCCELCDKSDEPEHECFHWSYHRIKRMCSLYRDAGYPDSHPNLHESHLFLLQVRVKVAELNERISLWMTGRESI